LPCFDIIKETKLSKSFRVELLKSMYDINTNCIREKFSGEIPIENEEWNIGVICGASGTGKSTIAKTLFADFYIERFNYSASSVIEDMPAHADVRTIARVFNSVGFSSPPSWLKPYEILSTGEKMRVDLARAILEDREIIVFDEFTSTIHREVAKIGSIALQKAIRKFDRKFIAVTCHYDILDYLEPDWIFDTNTYTFEKKNFVRPVIKM